MNYYEFAMNKNGKLLYEKRSGCLDKKYIELLKNYHKRNPKKSLYQLTTHKQSPDERVHFWSLWIQIKSKTKEQAIKICDKIRVGILNGDLPIEGLLDDENNVTETSFGNNYLKVRNHAYQIILLLEEFGIEPKNGVEIGVQTAQNASSLLKMIPDLHLILADNYDDAQTIPRQNTQVLKNLAFSRVHEFENRITWILKPSVEAANEVEDKSLDYVFIDAEHTYKAVTEDIKAWLPKVKKGGLLLGHDFNKRHHKVKEAVIDRFGKDVFCGCSVWCIKVTKEILNQ